MTQTNQIERLRVQVKTLKEGDLNLASMLFIADAIFQALNNEKANWEVLGTNKFEINSLLNEQLKKEFLSLFQEYQAGSKQLADLIWHFKQIAEKINRAQLSFKELEPFTCSDFFSLKAAMRNQESRD
jgi:hypothetical protein